MSILNKYNFYINSRERISGDVNNFTVQLKTPLLLTSNKSRFEIYMSSMEYPYAFNQVNVNNNTFTLKVYNSMVLQGTYTVSIPIGNYNILSLIDAIETQVLTVSSLPGVNFVGTYNKTSGRVVFSTTSVVYSFELFFSGTTIGRMVGFTSDVLVGFGSSQTSQQNVNVNPTTYICLRADVITSNKDQEALSSKGENSDILCKIPIRTPPGTFIYYKMDFDDRIYLTTEIIQTINFRITPGNELDTIDNNNLNFTFALTILETVIPEALTHDKITDVIPTTDIEALTNELRTHQENLINDLVAYKKNLSTNND